MKMNKNMEELSNLRKLQNFIYKEEDEVPDFVTSRLTLYRLLSELSADRYGYIACGGDEETAITTEYKLSSGIDISKMHVQLQALIEENKKHLAEELQKYNSDGTILTGFCLREMAEKTLMNM